MRAAVVHTQAAAARPSGATAAAARRAAVPRRVVLRRAVEAPGAEVPPLSEEVAALLAEQGLDFERSGLKYLSNEARVSGTGARGCWPARLGGQVAALWTLSHLPHPPHSLMPCPACHAADAGAGPQGHQV